MRTNQKSQAKMPIFNLMILRHTRLHTSNYSIENRANTCQPVIRYIFTTSIDNNSTFPIVHLTSVGILHFNPNTEFFFSLNRARSFYLSLSLFLRIFVHRFSISETFPNLSPFAICIQFENVSVFECIEPTSQHTNGSGKIVLNYQNSAAVFEWLTEVQKFLRTKQLTDA